MSKCKPGYYYCFTNKECKPIPPGFMIDPAGMLAKENGHTVDEACWIGYKQVGMKKKGKKIVPNCVKEEGLRKWFKGSSSKDGKGGWVNVVTGGTCASDEPGEGVPKCVSSSKRASMTPAERRSAAARKKRQDPGQQSKSGAAKPTYVSTDSPTKKMKNEEYVNEKTMTSTEKKKKEEIVKSMKKDVSGFKNRYGDRAKDVMYATATKMAMKKESFNENHKAIAGGKEKDEEGYMASTEMDTIDSAVKKLRKNIKKGDMQLPAWVQSKITKAADYIDTAADYMDSNEMSEESDKKTKGSGTKDACYTKVKSRYSVWPSAYASGALVKCRKVGAANWGNSSKNEEIVHEGDFWHPDPEKDKKLGGPGPNQRAREDRAAKPKKDSKKLRPGESYMDYAKRKQRGESFVPDKSESLSPISLKVLEDLNLDEKCWVGYKKKGMKTMFGKKYPNCVKVEGTSFEIGAGHNLAKKAAKIRNLATGTTNPNEKSAALKKLSGPSLPLADSFELKNNTNVTIEDLEGNTFIEVVDLIRPEPITGFKSQVKEATRLQADTGNIIAVILSWRGKTYSVRMFFPQVGMPNRKDVTTEIQKI